MVATKLNLYTLIANEPDLEDQAKTLAEITCSKALMCQTHLVDPGQYLPTTKDSYVVTQKGSYVFKGKINSLTITGVEGATFVLDAAITPY